MLNHIPSKIICQLSHVYRFLYLTKIETKRSVAMTYFTCALGKVRIAPHQSVTREPDPPSISLDTINLAHQAHTSKLQYLHILFYSASKNICCPPMNQKIDISHEVKSNILVIDPQFQNQIKSFDCHNSREFPSSAMTQFSQSKCIRHFTKPAYQPKSKSFLEAVSRTISKQHAAFYSTVGSLSILRTGAP